MGAAAIARDDEPAPLDPLASVLGALASQEDVHATVFAAEGIEPVTYR